jgi:hypothetical protein
VTERCRGILPLFINVDSGSTNASEHMWYIMTPWPVHVLHCFLCWAYSWQGGHPTSLRVEYVDFIHANKVVMAYIYFSNNFFKHFVNLLRTLL